jgi:dTDP-L-rhamnose 4-epimerase
MYETILENKSFREKIQKIVVASSKSIYGEGAYVCKKDGVVYPNPRSIEQLKRKDWEVYCPFCSLHVKPIGITEEKPPQNLTVYALSKYDTEKIAMNFMNVLDIPTVVFRYFNVYGPRQSLNNPYTGVTAIFLSRIKNDNPPIVYEDGKQLRDFIYVEDVAAANLLALEKEDTSGIFNVGTGNAVSIEQIARTLIKLTDSSVEPKITNEYRPGDNRYDFADISKIKKHLGFKPKWSFERGFEKLVEWSQTQEAVDKFEQAERERHEYLGV